ncbi:kanadaptin [Zophobas morio]|uniref:kanadaptin n=1 Tax=Zophobas morio TaxID=2755281 RepID=UPI003082C1C7
MDAEDTEAPKDEKKESPFKKPMLVGKIGKLPKKLKTPAPPLTIPEPVEAPPDITIVEPDTPKPPENRSLPYEEPPWSALPQASHEYNLEVLKSGAIIETINVMEKAFWVFGRLTNCDVCMQHPTISRYHAVLQYRKAETADKTGFYIYDLESTHGTFLNKRRIKPRSYVRMNVGHMLKLGCSTRTYILTGPDEDTEEESPLTVTELKQKREQELLQRQLDKAKEEERRKRDEDRGIDWGLGEDADEETDLTENPFAQTNNEDLYLENPKKALRGFFEREGLELEYDCTEQGIGQFVCKVELPVDDEVGRPIFAEVFHKGKKKEAVIQCALEACRILDRHGLLRQATHESKKRKPKNWEENDFYDSDDDTFLDRTGTVEKKREKRMSAKVPQKAETYESLMEKEKSISSGIRKLEAEIADSQRKLASLDASSSAEVDPLDSFMMELKQSKPSKQTVNKLKADLVKLKQEHANVIKLVNIARPASLPPLVAEYATTSVKSLQVENKALPVFGKRKKIKVQLSVNKQSVEEQHANNEDEEEEEEEEEEVETKKETLPTKMVTQEEKEARETKDETEAIAKRRRKNQRRIQQKQERAESEKRKGYEEDASKEDYNMWVPPTGQTGDGRTALNEKYGY